MTLMLASFMLLVLFSVPLLMDTSGFDDFLPYALYSLLLASIGVLIGISLTWLNLARGVESDVAAVERGNQSSQAVAATPSNSAEQSPFSRLSTDEALVVDYLQIGRAHV